MWPTQVPLSRNLKWWQSHHLSEAVAQPAGGGIEPPPSWAAHTASQKRPGLCVRRLQVCGPAFFAGCVPRAAPVLSQVVCGGRPGTPRGRAVRPMLSVGGLLSWVACRPPPCVPVLPPLGPGRLPHLGVRGLWLPGCSCPLRLPGLVALPSGRVSGWGVLRGSCPGFSRCLPGGRLLRAVSSFGFPGPLPRPAPLLRSSGFSRRASARQVGAGAQARKGGSMRRPTDHAALPSLALCSPRRTRPMEAGQTPGGSRERMPPGLPSGPVGLALPGRLTVQKK